MSTRIEVRLNDLVELRLDMMKGMFGMERQQILLAAFAQFMPSIQPSEKQEPEPRRKRKSQTKTNTKPSLGEGNKPKDKKEVVAYFKQRQVSDPLEPKAELFFDHYQSKGWVVGRSPVKNWGSCLTVWLKNNPDWRPVPSTNKETVSINDFLDWAKEHRSPVFDKYRLAETIQDIDQLYIDEYADNNQ